MSAMTRDAVVAIRAASRPHGFNIGMNLGGVAGGSLSEHLHQHVVPRWGGDANFITVLGQTKVMPQLLADTRDLLREHWPALITFTTLGDGSPAPVPLTTRQRGERATEWRQLLGHRLGGDVLAASARAGRRCG